MAPRGAGRRVSASSRVCSPGPSPRCARGCGLPRTDGTQTTGLTRAGRLPSAQPTVCSRVVAGSRRAQQQNVGTHVPNHYHYPHHDYPTY